MIRKNTAIQNAAAELREAFTAETPENSAIETAFENFGAAIAASVHADYESAHGDQNILIQRGFRVLTAEERKYYNAIIEAGKEKTVQAMNGLLVDKVMPNTIIEDVYKNLTEEHPLLSRINFQSVEYLTRWIINDHSVKSAVWGPINSHITEQIESAFRVIEIAQCKLAAYAVIPIDMLDLGPVFLDGYIRAFLKEAVLVALEEAIITGSGHNMPIGMDRDISQGASISSSTGYSKKAATNVTSFEPKEYGKLCAMLAKTETWYTADDTDAVTASETAANSDGSAKEGYTKHGGRTRLFNEVTLICNQTDYLTKIMPATTVLNAAGAYTKDIFPFPTEVIRSAAIPEGEAILCLPEEYFMGVGTGKEGTIIYSDEFKFLEDKRTFKIKMHGMGKAFDNTCAIRLNIANLEEAYILVKDMAEPTM